MTHPHHSDRVSAAPNFRFWAALCFVLLAAALRIIPHPPNFSPIAAMALFGGAVFTGTLWAFALPLAALFVSDLVLGFHSMMPAVYLSFAFVVALGLILRGRRTPGRVALASVTGSVLFFLITNFAVWTEGTMYPMTAQGLLMCYTAALPFLQNSLAGDLVFTSLIFGAWSVIEASVPAIRLAGRRELLK